MEGDKRRDFRILHSMHIFFFVSSPLSMQNSTGMSERGSSRAVKFREDFFATFFLGKKVGKKKLSVASFLCDQRKEQRKSFEIVTRDSIASTQSVNFDAPAVDYVSTLGSLHRN